MINANNIYIYHHIPKCGGTSFLNILNKWFNVIKDYRTGWEINYPKPIITENLTTNDCLCGHFELDGFHLNQRYPEIFKDKKFKLITLIRDPLEVQLSLFRYEQKHKVSTVSNIEEHLQLRQNYIASIFSVTDTDFKNIIDKYYFTGILEHAQASVDILAKAIGKPAYLMPIINITDKNLFQETQNIKSKLNVKFKKENQLDYEIYNYCLNKFKLFIREHNRNSVVWSTATAEKKTVPVVMIRKELPVISIVTPSLNQGAFLEACIDSILGQGYPKLEYIIMDGGSTDDSAKIIKKYEKHLTYWKSKQDGGQYWAINAGLQMTTGTIMSWLNSDDRLFPYTLNLMAELFSTDNKRHWITGLCNHIDANGKMTYLAKEAPKYSRFKYLCKEFSKPFIQQEGTFWSRQLWEKSGGYISTDYTLAGDLELWTRLFRHDVLHVVNCPTGSFRKYGNQKSQLFYDKYIQEAEKIIDQEIIDYKNENFSFMPLPPETILV